MSILHSLVACKYAAGDQAGSKSTGKGAALTLSASAGWLRIPPNHVKQGVMGLKHALASLEFRVWV
jgi:hypothetical protein